MRKFFFLLVATLLLLILPHTTYAQTDWTINAFTSDITIQSDGKVKVIEKLDVDFASVEKHGIYRDIPYVYQTSSHDTKYTELQVTDVTRDTKKEPYEVITNNNHIRIKIGDADKTISGRHIYTLTYLASGVIVPYDTYDELYWNVTGSYWEVPILKTSATLHLEKPGIIQTACYYGVPGSTTQCRDQKIDEQTATFSTDTLQPGEELTIAAGFQKGLIPILTVERPKTFWERLIEPFNIALFLLLTVSGVGFVVRKWHLKGRDFWTKNNLTTDSSTKGVVKPIGSHETIVVEFAPPEKLRPAEMGVILDEKADTLDITATVIDLARRGYLTIEEVKKTWLLGKSDYILNRKKKEEGALLPYESELLTRLFASESSVKLSTLKLTFYDDLKHVKTKLYKTITDKNLFIGNPESVRQKYLLFGILLTVLPFAFFYITGILLMSPILITVASSITIIGLTVIVVSQKMARRSAYGRDLYRRALGYRLFISGAEKYRQRFYEQKNLFDEILPYAIIFGLTEKYAQAMKEIGLKQNQPSWYTGYTPFHPVMFASSMNSFSKALSTTMAAAPSSSGSGGGGSSGGGFGGGGGGSW